MLAARTNLSSISRRVLSTSACLCGRKSRLPWDKRFPVSAEDVGPDKKGGSKEMAELLPEKLEAPTGFYHAVTKEYIHVPEMVPEFVVPDLTGFELKPYVSYQAKEINQSKLTPQDIFNSVYAPDIEDDVRDGKIQIIDGKIKLADGRILDIAEYDIDREDKTS